MDRWTIATVAIVLAILITGLTCYEVSQTKATVKYQASPVWKGDDVMISIQCENISFGRTAHCIIGLNLTKPNVTKEIGVKEIFLDGYPIWPTNRDGKASDYNPYISRTSVKLKLTNVRETIVLAIDLNDNFEVYYFGHDYLRKAICGELRRGTHLITVIFDNNASVSETFEIKG